MQIDHVVALSDSWQKGAQQWDAATREAFANDPLNLLAVDGPLNQQKGDGDTATWLPPNKAFRCAYVARQVGVKYTYGLWVTQAEQDAMVRVLSTCPTEPLPVGPPCRRTGGADRRRRRSRPRRHARGATRDSAVDLRELHEAWAAGAARCTSATRVRAEAGPGQRRDRLREAPGGRRRP